MEGSVGVDRRPKLVESRSRSVDIEVDLMMGSNHKLELLVITGRATLVTIIEKLSSKKADEVYRKTNTRLTNFSTSWIKIIIFDNGKEFAQQ